MIRLIIDNVPAQEHWFVSEPLGKVLNPQRALYLQKTSLYDGTRAQCTGCGRSQGASVCLHLVVLRLQREKLFAGVRAGGRRQEAGGRRQEAGDRRQEAGASKTSSVRF